MFDPINLLTLLLAPVIAYVAAALIFSAIERVKKNQAVSLSQNQTLLRNGH